MKCVSLALTAAMLVAPIQSSAQAPSGSSVLSGRVTQAGDTTIAVGGADVEIVGTALRRFANGEGRFRFKDMLPGTYELCVRRLGYEPASLRVVLEGGRSYEQAVDLHRHPNALTEVRIEGRMLKVPARFEDVYARAAHEHGTFFTRKDIDKLNPYDVQSLLNLVPTVYANDRGITFQRCQAGLSGLSIGSRAHPGRVPQRRLRGDRDLDEVLLIRTRVASPPAESATSAVAKAHFVRARRCMSALSPY